MSNPLPLYPFDAKRRIGVVSEVSPDTLKVNLPQAVAPDGQWHHGYKLAVGGVGDFVVVECGELAIFGRIVATRLPERDRLQLLSDKPDASETHPTGTIQMLATLALATGDVVRGVVRYPRLGSHLYAAPPQLVKWIVETRARTALGRPNAAAIRLGSVHDAGNTLVMATPEGLFGRHCAVLGATGGGKSWTLARLMEQAEKLNAKVVLFDATGEFHTLRGRVRHLHIGTDPNGPVESTEVAIPYTDLMISDLFALFKPSTQTQAPKLREAIKTLRIAKASPGLLREGVVPKANQDKSTFLASVRKNRKVIESHTADFDITPLPQQILEECVWPTGGSAAQPDTNKWGRPDESAKGHCVTLVTRIDEMIHSPQLATIFGSKGKRKFFEEFEKFMADPSLRILRLSLEYLPSDYDAKAIIMNAIARQFLTRARDNAFEKKPVVLFVDEAHQFLSKTIGEEYTKFQLDCFDQIAKEGRKFSLTLCIATQRPRDIPEGVLSQMGTLIVHRLTNDRDRETVERAAGELDRSAAEFVPNLGPGEAILLGVDFPIPLTIQIGAPESKPDSSGPDYQRYWMLLPTPADPNREEQPLSVEVKSKDIAERPEHEVS